MNAHCPIPVNFVEGFLDSIRRGGGRRLFQDLELRRAFGGIGNQKRVECFTKFGGQKSLCVSPQDFGCGKPGGRDIAFKKIKTRAENLLIPQLVGGHPQQSQGTVVFEGALGEPFNQQVTIGAGLSPEPEGGHGFQPVVGSGPGTLPVGRAAFGGNADLSREETERLLGNSSRFIGKKTEISGGAENECESKPIFIPTFVGKPIPVGFGEREKGKEVRFQDAFGPTRQTISIHP